MLTSLGLIALLLGVGADPDLAAAERAFEEGRYQDVLPALDRALAQPLPLEQRRRALELQAITHAAFDDSRQAVQSFRQLLAVDPQYRPGVQVSPKVRGLFEEAARLGPVGPAVAAEVLPTKAEERPEPPLYAKGWFWAAVGAIAAGTAAGLWYASQPAMPAGNLGRGVLQ